MISVMVINLFGGTGWDDPSPHTQTQITRPTLLTPRTPVQPRHHRSGHTLDVIEAKNLGRRFGWRWIFRHFEFELKAGDCLAVLGSNGSGKSTLLRVLAGLLEPSEGSVLRSTWGYSALDLSVYPTLSAREHLQFASETRCLPDPRMEILDEVGLSSAQDQLAGQYSTGMRARLKLALAIQSRPAVLMLDEPSASLDERGQEILGRVLQAQLETGAVILATNDPADRRWANLEVRLDEP